MLKFVQKDTISSIFITYTKSILNVLEYFLNMNRIIIRVSCIFLHFSPLIYAKTGTIYWQKGYGISLKGSNPFTKTP